MHIVFRAPRLLASGAALALVAAGCGSSAPHSATTSGKPRGLAAQAFAFSRCMRSHGVANFPDPQVSTSAGGTKVAIRMVGPNGSTPPSKAALAACHALLPGPGTAKGNPAQDRARAQDLLAFARCLRSHGVPNFPDPTSQGQLSRQMITAAGVDLQAPAVLPAAHACVGVTHGMITMAQVRQAVNGGG